MPKVCDGQVVNAQRITRAAVKRTEAIVGEVGLEKAAPCREFYSVLLYLAGKPFLAGAVETCSISLLVVVRI